MARNLNIRQAELRPGTSITIRRDNGHCVVPTQARLLGPRRGRRGDEFLQPRRRHGSEQPAPVCPRKIRTVESEPDHVRRSARFAGPQVRLAQEIIIGRLGFAGRRMRCDFAPRGVRAQETRSERVFDGRVAA